MKLCDLFKKSEPNLYVSGDLLKVLRNRPYGKVTRLYNDEGDSWVVLHEHDFKDILKRAKLAARVVES